MQKSVKLFLLFVHLNLARFQEKKLTKKLYDFPRTADDESSQENFTQACKFNFVFRKENCNL